jgi:DNA-binding transcriptional ArsR family regulator
MCAMSPPDDAADQSTALPGDVPVTMPDLPPTLLVTTEQQFKAVSDPMRGRIIQVLRTQPATAKQLADLLGGTTGAIGHHLQVLEAAGLVQVIARRLVHGIVAKYYARTARIFIFELPRETVGVASMDLVMLTQAREELIEALPTIGQQGLCDSWFPHKRLAPARMAVYQQRINQLVVDFLRETPDPDGVMYSLIISAFRSPAYLQASIPSAEADAEPDH